MIIRLWQAINDYTPEVPQLLPVYHSRIKYLYIYRSPHLGCPLGCCLKALRLLSRTIIVVIRDKGGR